MEALNPKNLQLWYLVEQTDPEFTKRYKGKGGFEGSSLNSMYLTKKATGVWGPVGKGWGYDILEERYDEGAPLSVFPGTDFVIRAVVHTIKLRLWYKQDGEEHSVVHYGHTDFVYSDKFGVKTDSEAPKKSLTDALKKCLSMVGFSADVFMGKFDDQDYVEQATNVALLAKADNRAEEEARQAAEYREWLENHANLIGTATHINELQRIYTAVCRKLKNRNDQEQILRMTRLKDKRKAELDMSTLT